MFKFKKGDVVRITSYNTMSREDYVVTLRRETNAGNEYKLKDIIGWWHECNLMPSPTAQNKAPVDAEVEGPDTLLPEEEMKSVGENEAFWEFHEDELYYTCSNCGCSALNDCFGQSTDSKFCPHCGKYMINSTIEED